MKYLVTGGAGFIGSHLVEELIKLGDVTVIDDLSEGSKDNLNLDKITFIEGDIRHNLPSDIFDVVYHLGAKHNVRNSFKCPIAYFDVNIQGSWKVFSKYNCRIVNISSSTAKKCKSPYAISKRATEKCAELFPNVVTLRYFNVIGERQSGCIVPAFCKAILNGDRPIIFGDGTQSRDYTYVKDVVAQTIPFGTNKQRGIFDMGYGESHSTKEIFNIIAKLLNYTEEPIYEEAKKGDTQSMKSNRVIEDGIGFEEGIKRTVKWFKVNK